MHHLKFLKSSALALTAVVLGLFVGFADHGDAEYINAPAGFPAPTVDVAVHADPLGGYNVQVITTNWQYTGAFVNQAPIPNEGHGHLFVDGEQVARLYSDWYYIGDLHEGLHEVRVTLNANNHLPWAVDNEIIQAVAIVNVAGAGDGHGHGHDDGHGGGGHSHGSHFEVTTNSPAGFPAPEVRLSVEQDSAKGWNLTLVTTNFNFSPERVSTSHVFNEGHAHVYVDGVRGQRIYSTMFHIDNLTPGGHTIEVRLATNDHREYTNNGVLIASAVDVFETRAAAGGHGHGGGEEEHGDEGHDDSDGHHDDDDGHHDDDDGHHDDDEEDDEE